jgi:hypothetical protein
MNLGAGLEHVAHGTASGFALFPNAQIIDRRRMHYANAPYLNWARRTCLLMRRRELWQIMMGRT